MVNGDSPKSRLSRLFHKSGSTNRNGAAYSSPPSSPPSASATNQRTPRQRTSSRGSLRDVFSSSHKTPPRNQPRQSAETPADRVPSYGAQAAAATALGQQDRLSQIPAIRREPDLSSDFENLNFGNGYGEGRRSENVADRNISNGSASVSPPSSEASRLRGGVRSKRSQPIIPQADPHSSDVADWNIAQRGKAPAETYAAGNAPSSFGIQSGKEVRGGEHRYGIPPVGTNGQPVVPARRAVGADRHSRGSDSFHSVSEYATRSSLERGTAPEIPRSSLDKPLPVIPTGASSPATGISSGLPRSRDIVEKPSARSVAQNGEYLVKDSTAPVDLSRVVDLTNTKDTTVHETWAPAVTHEQIVEQDREIREEVVTREIHNHHVFHRKLPIVDIEVLPSRHYIPVQGGYAEIAEEELPGRVRDKANSAIAQFVSQKHPEDSQQHGPRQFSACKFEGTEHDAKAYIAPEGHKKTEQWWVHPPTAEDGGQRTGQSYPFYFGSADPRDDGLRARLPEGDVIGTSEFYAQKLRERSQQKTPDSRRNMSAGKAVEAPPVPVHRELPSKSGAGERKPYTLPPVPAHQKLPRDWDTARNSLDGARMAPPEDALSPRFI